MFIVAGAAVIIVGLAGHRVQGWDVALFIIALLVLAAATSGLAIPSNNHLYSYSATKTQINVSQIDVNAKAGFGSININFSDSNQLAYQVAFSRYVGFPFFFVGGDQNFTLTNQTRDGILILNATSSLTSITITLGSGYLVNINATSSTGSVSLNTAKDENFGSVYLNTGTGSVNAMIDAQNISGIHLQTGTGSINLRSDYLSPSSTRIPISVSTGTGSTNLDLKIPNTVAVGINASNGVGSLSHNLQGFTISQSSSNRLEATSGNISNATRSFLIGVSSGTGSISLNISMQTG